MKVSLAKIKIRWVVLLTLNEELTKWHFQNNFRISTDWTRQNRDSSGTIEIEKLKVTGNKKGIENLSWTITNNL